MAISKPGADAVPTNLILLGAALSQGPCSYFYRPHFPEQLGHPPAQSSHPLLLLQLPRPRSPRPAGAAAAAAWAAA